MNKMLLCLVISIATCLFSPTTGFQYIKFDAEPTRTSRKHFQIQPMGNT